MAAIRFWILDFGIWIAAPWDFGMGIWKIEIGIEIEIGIDPFHASAFDTDSDFDLDNWSLTRANIDTTIPGAIQYSFGPIARTGKTGYISSENRMENSSDFEEIQACRKSIL